MITIEQFCKCIETLSDFNCSRQKASENVLYSEALISTTIFLLEESMQDREGLISHICYDLDFGKDLSLNPIKMDREEDIYDIIDLYNHLYFNYATPGICYKTCSECSLSCPKRSKNDPKKCAW